MLIDAGFLSLAKKLYIGNENAVNYILGMFYKCDSSRMVIQQIVVFRFHTGDKPDTLSNNDGGDRVGQAKFSQLVSFTQKIKVCIQVCGSIQSEGPYFNTKAFYKT